MNSPISRLQRPGYDLQKEQAIQEAIVVLQQLNAERDDLRAKIKATEEDRSRFLVEIGKLCAQCDALRTKIAEMERQGLARLVTPTAYRWRYRGAIKWQYGELTEENARLAKEHNHEVQPIYALPGAQPAWGSQAVLDVTAERRRQIEVEGWTPEHDDEHSAHALAEAAACYCLSSAGKPFDYFETTWPWERWWFKASGTRRDLVKAGALILAEVERLDRAAAEKQEGE